MKLFLKLLFNAYFWSFALAFQIFLNFESFVKFSKFLLFVTNNFKTLNAQLWTFVLGIFSISISENLAIVLTANLSILLLMITPYLNLGSDISKSFMPILAKPGTLKSWTLSFCLTSSMICILYIILIPLEEDKYHLYYFILSITFLSIISWLDVFVTESIVPKSEYQNLDRNYRLNLIVKIVFVIGFIFLIWLFNFVAIQIPALS